MRKSTRSVEERFWEKVHKTESCWIWTATSSGGTFPYGVFKYDGRQTNAHRACWLMVRGPIPDGLVVCHKCDNPRCVRPDHLFLGTQQDNIDDCIRKGRNPRGESNGIMRRDRPIDGPRHRKTEGPLGPWYYRGSANHKAKLTDDQVREIRRIYRSERISNRRIAERFGVSKSIIFDVVHYRTYVHVSDEEAA